MQMLLVRRGEGSSERERGVAESSQSSRQFTNVFDACARAAPQPQTGTTSAANEREEEEPGSRDFPASAPSALFHHSHHQ